MSSLLSQVSSAVEVKPVDASFKGDGTKAWVMAGKMGRALDTTIFVKNGACVAGLGIGGEGYLSYTIATPTGEGVTNPRTFTRIRRCVMADHLRII